MAPCDLNVRWTYLRLRQERHKAIESVMFARRKRWFDRIMKTNKGDEMSAYQQKVVIGDAVCIISRLCGIAADAGGLMR
jgi:hypothetical protein